MGNGMPRRERNPSLTLKQTGNREKQTRRLQPRPPRGSASRSYDSPFRSGASDRKETRCVFCVAAGDRGLLLLPCTNPTTRCIRLVTASTRTTANSKIDVCVRREEASERRHRSRKGRSLQTQAGKLHRDQILLQGPTPRHFPQRVFGTVLSTAYATTPTRNRYPF